MHQVCQAMQQQKNEAGLCFSRHSRWFSSLGIMGQYHLARAQNLPSGALVMM
jgi:hypothetical protein